MSLIKPKAPRWYWEHDGVVEACYTMPKKDGSGMKDTTLREARELGLLPSVTSILRVMAQPGLERYKLGQVIYSAMTLPREREDCTTWEHRVHATLMGMESIDGLRHAYDNPPRYIESDDAFAKRVVEDSEAQAAKAAEFGTRIHDVIAEIMTKAHQDQRWGGGIAMGLATDEELVPYLSGFIAWATDNIDEIHAVEKVVGGKHCGYAGRLDLDCTLRGVGRTLIDFKTTAVREGKAPVFYEDSWLPQLVAYRNACTDSIPRIMSLVIDSRAPGPVWPKLWDDSDMAKGRKIFRHCLELWMVLNDYDPVFDPTAGVKQAREDYADKQMGLNPRSI